MEFEVAEAYANGRLAGARHFRAKKSNPDAKRPNNPYPATSYLASVEWDRGFGDGYGQAERQASPRRETDAA